MDKTYKLGLCSVSFRNLSPIEIIDICKSANLNFIEWGSDVHAPYNDMEKLENIARLQKENSITCSSYGTYFRLGVTPLGELEKYIIASKILGTNILRIWCYDKCGNDMTDKEKQDLLCVSIKASEIAKQNGVILCLECHKNSFTENLNDALWLIKSVNSPNFKSYFQPFQWKTEIDNLNYAKAISPYVENIHVFNWKQTDTFNKYSLSLAVGEWVKYLKNFTPPKTLLLEFMPNDKIEDLIVETNALKQIVESL